MKGKPVFIFSALIALLVPSLVWGAIELKFANFFPVPAAHSKICEEFIKDLEQRTGGEVKIRFFTAGTLLTAPKIYDGIETGIADIGFSNIGYTFGRFRMTEALDLPLGFPNAWVANHVANDFYRQFKPKEWDKIHMLSLHASPVNVVLSATKQVTKMEDLKGMTLRGLGYIAEVVSALGGTARPIPMPESYEAVQKRVIDGLMSPMETLRAFRLAEVAKYATECWPIGGLLLISFFLCHRHPDIDPKENKSRDLQKASESDNMMNGRIFSNGKEFESNSQRITNIEKPEGPSG